MYEQMRQHERFAVTNPIDSYLVYMKVGSQDVFSNPLKIIIEDMSLGGMKILCTFDVGNPKESNFCFVLPVFDDQIYVKGDILRKVSRENGQIEYGVQFCLEEDEVSITEDLVKFQDYIKYIEEAS